MAFKRLFADFADKNLSDLWAELNRRIELSFASAVDKLVRVQDSDTTSGYLLDKLQPGEGITLTAQNVGGDETIEVSAPGSTTDQLVKVQASDTTPSYLASKLVAGANVALTPQSVGGNETLRVDASGAGADELVKVSVADTTPGFLGSKIANGTNIAWTVLNPGANEQLRGNVTIPAQPDQLVRVQASDTTSGYLNSKLVAGTNVTLTPQNVGGNQTLRVDAAGGGGAGGTLDVVLGQFVQADQLVYLDAPRNSAWPEARAHQCHQGIDFYTSIIFEQGGAWDAAPSQPYCYDACAVSAEVAVALRVVNSPAIVDGFCVLYKSPTVHELSVPP